MNPLSPEQQERARKNHAAILRALAKVGQNVVADALGCDESTVSRMKDKRDNGKPGEIERMALVLSAMGLKCVAEDMRCFAEAEINALLVLAKARLKEVESIEQLVWEQE